MKQSSSAGKEHREAGAGPGLLAKARAHGLVPYAAAVVATAAATGLTLSLWPVNSRSIFAFHFLALFGIAIYGHARAAVLVLVLSILVVHYVPVEPYLSFAATTNSFYSLSLSTFVGGAIIFLIENLKAQGRRLLASERGQRELAQQLEAERARLVAAQAVAKIGSWETDLATLTVVWSAETYRIFGVAMGEGEATHERYLALVHPDDRAAVNAAFAASLEQCGPGAIAHRIMLPEGGSKWVEERWMVVCDEQGKPLRAVGTCQDITERQLAGDALREKDALIRIAGRLTHTGSWAVSVSDQRVFYSDDLCDILERPRSREMPLSDGLALHPEPSRSQVAAALAACARDGTPFDLEVEAVTATGRHIWGRLCGQAERDAEGVVCRVQGAFQDITPRKQAEEMLRRSEEGYRRVIETAHEGIWMIDAQGRTTYVNQRVADLLGYTPTEMMGRFHTDFMWEEDRPKGDVDLEQRRQSIHQVWDQRYRRKDGSELWTVASCNGMFGPDGAFTGALGMFTDITERKAAEAALRKSEASLLAAQTRAKIGSWEMDLVNQTATWSTEMFRIFQRDQSLGAAPLDECIEKIHPDDREPFQHGFAQAIQDRRGFKDDLRIVLPDGDIRWLELCGELICDGGGQPIRMIGTSQDITERKQHMETLRATIESALDCIITIDERNTIIEFNPASEQTFGWSSADAIGRSLSETIFPPRFRAGHEQGMAKLLAGGQPRLIGKRIEITAMRHTGTEFPIELTVVQIERGHRVRYTAFIRDITERNEAQIALRKEQEFLAAVVDNVSDGIVSCDANGVIALFNPATCEFHGLPAEPIAADEWAEHFDLYLPDGRTLMRKEQVPLFRALEEGVVREVEMVIAPRQGTPRRILASGQAFFNERGEKLGAVVAMHDITGQRQAQEAIHRQSHMLDHIGQAVIATDTAGLIVYANRFAGELYGWPPAEMQGRPIIDVTVAAAKRKEAEEVMGQLNDGENWNGEFLMQDRDGRVFPAWVTNSPLLDEGGHPVGIIGISTDISSRKQADAERDEMHQQLVKASRQAGMAEVATSVLHNVGNVLNSVNISATLAADQVRRSCGSDVERIAGLLEQHRDDLPGFLASPQGAKLPGFLTGLAQHLGEEQRGVLGELQSLSAHIDHIKEIVGMQQAHARLAAVSEQVPAETLVEDALRLNAAALAHHGIELVRDFGEARSLEVDKHKALQILVNLIRNATEAMNGPEAHGKRMTLRIGDHGSGFLSFSVGDEGGGISPENMPRIFEHGFTTRREGHGFGLHSAALAAREMGGSLTAHSAGPGAGAVFTLSLPFPIQSPL